MKYMGSKRILLQNGLGDILKEELCSAARLVDLFCGAGSVSWFVSSRLKKPVLACDLQLYAVTLVGAVIKRTRTIDVQMLDELWLQRAEHIRSELRGWRQATRLDTGERDTEEWWRASQDLCSSNIGAPTSIIWRSYGGHYFSATQALSFDAMLNAMPDKEEFEDVCLAATIMAASRCAASPGHTAQPFKATRTAKKYLQEAWRRDPFVYARAALESLCSLHSFERGSAIVADANELATELETDDVVFVDPPYSAVQYSRFYHVLETIARKNCENVEGVGRYPPPNERPNSRYSRKGGSMAAISDLLHTLRSKECTVVLTFPRAECSNGLSGDMIKQIASGLFDVSSRSVRRSFSTLGGNKINRTARSVRDELVLILKSN